MKSKNHSKTLEEFQNLAAQHWDTETVKQKVIQDQGRRRFIHSALRTGLYEGWDFNPKRDSGKEFTRSHFDLSNFDSITRYPRPKSFKPRWK